MIKVQGGRHDLWAAHLGCACPIYFGEARRRFGVDSVSLICPFLNHMQALRLCLAAVSVAASQPDTGVNIERGAQDSWRRVKWASGQPLTKL